MTNNLDAISISKSFPSSTQDWLEPSIIISGRRGLPHYVVQELIDIQYLDLEGTCISTIKVKQLPSKMNNYDKGRLGEILVSTIINLTTGIEVEETVPGWPYDLEINNNRIDVKFSPIYFKKNNYPFWQFNLKHGKFNRTVGKYEKVSKDFKSACDYLILIGINPDRTVSLFIIASSLPEINILDNIKIPVDFSNSKWAKYYTPIQFSDSNCSLDINELFNKIAILN